MCFSDVPSYEELLFITDAAVNIAPDLETKADIVQNAIDLHIGLGLANLAWRYFRPWSR